MAIFHPHPRASPAARPVYSSQFRLTKSTDPSSSAAQAGVGIMSRVSLRSGSGLSGPRSDVRWGRRGIGTFLGTPIILAAGLRSHPLVPIQPRASENKAWRGHPPLEVGEGLPL